MFSNSVKDISRLKKISRILSKRTSNIYLKVTTETFSNFRFSGFKNLLTGSFWGTPTDTEIIAF